MRKLLSLVLIFPLLFSFITPSFVEPSMYFFERTWAIVLLVFMLDILVLTYVKDSWETWRK